MAGSWTSIFGAFGPSAFEMAPTGYWLCLAAGILASGADVTASVHPCAVTPLAAETRLGRAAWLLTGLGFFAIIPAVVLAMYLLFSSVGSGAVNGVQGRYYLVPLLLLAALGLYRAKLNWARFERPHLSTSLTAFAALASFLADVYALSAVAHRYWMP
jgi:hypothetical protein